MRKPPPPSRADREQQLAAALRANLRRRKLPKPAVKGDNAVVSEDQKQ